MDWFLYDSYLRHERVNYIALLQYNCSVDWSRRQKKNAVTVAYCASTKEFSRRSTRSFSGQGRFLEPVDFDKYLSYDAQK